MTNESVLRDIAVDVAIVKTRVECLPGLVVRIEALEKTDAKRTAWAAGAGAAVSALFTSALWVATRLHLLALALLLCCAAPSPLAHSAKPAEPTRHHWPTQVEMFADVDLGEECILSIAEALDFWIANGVTKIDRLVLTKGLEPGLGYITATVGDPGVERFVASTFLQVDGPNMLWADINFRPGYCTPLVAAHEIGHALGLDDSYTDIGNVMYWEVHDQGPAVTLEQIRAVQ